MAGKTLDDVGFGIAKTATNTGGTAVDVSASAARAANKFDPSSLMASMPGNSFFKNLELPQVSMKTSKLFHTPDALKNLKKLNVTDLVPRSTSDLLTSMSKTIDDVPTSSVDDVGIALAKVDVGDAAAVSKVAQNTSLGKLKNLSDQFASLAKKNTDLIGRKTTKLTDEALDSVPFNSADEMTDAMKNSKGLANFSDEAATGVLKSADEVADGSKSVVKKSADVVDDAAEQAKKSKLIKALEFAKKHDGKLNLTIIGSFMLAEHINGRADRDASSRTVEELAGDPGTEDASAAIEAGVSSELVGIEEGEEGVMTSDMLLAGVLALGAASLVL